MELRCRERLGLLKCKKGSNLLLVHLRNIIEKSAGSNPRF
jgi:hypothetical protein